MRSITFANAPIVRAFSGSWIAFTCLAPKLCGHCERINRMGVPPGAFVAAPMKFAMVQSTDRDGEPIADFSTHRTLLCELDMVRVRWGSVAKKTRLRRDKPQVVPITFSHVLEAAGVEFIDENGGAGVRLRKAQAV